MNLIEFSNKGLYCAQGGFYIDPWRAVDKALITHGHSDHARWGHKYYLSHHDTIPILKIRLGQNNNYQGLAYGEQLYINGVKVSFHPAGHIIGSAQVRLEYNGEIWVFSGDYKTEYDGISAAFEPVKCHTFITESTFGLPVYHWQPQQKIFDDMHQWWRSNQEKGIATVVQAYSLGKAQRILANLDTSTGPIYLHGAIHSLNKGLIAAGYPLPDMPLVDINEKKNVYSKSLIIAPPTGAGNAWLKRFQPYSMATASGWMAVRGTKRRYALDKGFALSDHADWPGLNMAIKETGASRVYVTHGYTAIFARYLQEQGLEAYPAETKYENGMNELEEKTEIAMNEEDAGSLEKEEA